MAKSVGKGSGKKDLPVLKLITVILVLEILGAVVTGIVINSDHAWYNALALPFFQPPTWVTDVIWLFLYVFMGSAAFLVYQEKGAKRLDLLFFLFGITVVLPIIRTYVVWQLQNLLVSTTLGAILWLLVVGLTLRFWRIEHKAGLLMLPVLLWTMFSLIVAISVLVLNGFLVV